MKPPVLPCSVLMDVSETDDLSLLVHLFSGDTGHLSLIHEGIPSSGGWKERKVSVRITSL